MPLWLCAVAVWGVGCYLDSSGIDPLSVGAPRAGCVDECQNGGVCVGRECFCGPVDFDGPTCEDVIDDCATVDCKNGKCVDLVRDFVCDCDELFATDADGLCTVEIEDCRTPNACDQGTCDDSSGQVTCICFPGYQGTRCNAPVNCGEPPQPPPDSVGAPPTGTEFGSTATFECKPGFLDASTTIRCQADATWELPQLTCIDVPGCGPPPPIEYGSASTPSGTDIGDVGYYSCDPGFYLVFYLSNTVVCQETEEWSPLFGACLLIGTCADDPCQHGQCTEYPNTITTFECTCDPGWSGPRCDI